MKPRDIEVIKMNLLYDPITGEFKRLTPRAPTKVGYRGNDSLIIRLYRGEHIVTMQAWRVAFILTHGQCPQESDICKFKDGNSFNLRMDNLEVIPKAHDELTLHEFAENNDISYGKLVRLMQGAPSIRRVSGGIHQLYYKLDDYKIRCAKACTNQQAGKRRIKKGYVPTYKSNPQALDFLRTFILPPVRWEWSLR